MDRREREERQKTERDSNRDRDRDRDYVDRNSARARVAELFSVREHFRAVEARAWADAKEHELHDLRELVAPLVKIQDELAPGVFAGVLSRPPIRVVLKFVRADIDDLLTLDTGDIADMGSLEAVTSVLVTRLVTSCATPHFALTYVCLPGVNDDGDEHVLLISERVEMPVLPFLRSALTSTGQTARVVNVLTWQVLQALAAAEARLQLHHNDLHPGNIMLTTVTPEVIRYVVEDRIWDVPNEGICVKLIDMGTANSGRLQKHVYASNDMEMFLERVLVTNPSLPAAARKRGERAVRMLRRFYTNHGFVTGSYPDVLVDMLQWWGETSQFAYHTAGPYLPQGCMRTPQVYTTDADTATLDITDKTRVTLVETLHLKPFLAGGRRRRRK